MPKFSPMTTIPAHSAWKIRHKSEASIRLQRRSGRQLRSRLRHGRIAWPTTLRPAYLKARAICLFYRGSKAAPACAGCCLGSLALNLFFVGAAGAVAFRYTSPVPLATVARIDHSLAGRLDRIATSLPPADAEIMRAQLRHDAEKVAAAQADLRLSQEDVRKSLRAEPFDADAMRTAMAENRARARQFRSGAARHDRRGGRQNVGRGPQQARRLAGRARRRTAAAVS